MLRFLFVLLLLNWVTFGLAQNNQIDSIQRALTKQTGLELVKSHHRLAVEYTRNEDFVNASTNNRKAQELLKKYPDSTFAIHVLNYKGIIYLNSNKLDSAISAFTELINFIGDNPTYVKYTIGAYGNRGICYDEKQLSHKGLEDLINALEIAKKHDQKNYMGVLYGSIAMNFHSQEEYEKAIEYHFEAIAIKKELNNPKSLAISYENLAISFSKVNKYNRAFEYFEKSRVIFKEVNDQIGLALCNHYAAIAYHQLYKQNFSSNVSEINGKKNQSLLDSAITMNRKAIEQLKEINNVFYVPEVEIEYANLLYSSKLYTESEVILKSLLVDLKDNYNSKERDVTKQLYEINKQKKNYDEALKWHERFLTIEDSLNNKNALKELGKRQAELAFNKEQELAELKHTKQIKDINFQSEKKQLIEENNRKKQTYFIVIISLACVIFLFFLIFVFRRWKITKLQKETINGQKLLIEKEKKATEDSINYAKNIQKAAFPTKELINTLFSESFIFFKPKDIVSGDFYWASKVKNKRILALADCTGHGVPGAFMTLISLNILNQIIADNIDSPQEILQELHTRIQKKLNATNSSISEYGLDIALCVIEDDMLYFAGTHNALYLVRNSKLEEYKSNQFQLGSNSKLEFSITSIKIQKDDIFYIFTDGFPDQKGGEKGKKYYYSKFRDLILKNAHIPIQEQAKELNNEFISWKGSQEQLDDVSIIGFKP